ncbi:MAG: hypothetical protein HY744_03165 [Deltaproteobacteria bacterium]|nr:hypothetical protein [Deltaproteobacteria bacterium]
MQRRWSLAACVLLALGAAGTVGCKTKAGDACTKGRAECFDDKTELSCQDGKFVAAVPGRIARRD